MKNWQFWLGNSRGGSTGGASSRARALRNCGVEREIVVIPLNVWSDFDHSKDFGIDDMGCLDAPDSIPSGASVWHDFKGSDGYIHSVGIARGVVPTQDAWSVVVVRPMPTFSFAEIT